jgi:hypothetical protein
MLYDDLQENIHKTSDPVGNLNFIILLFLAQPITIEQRLLPSAGKISTCVKHLLFMDCY